MKVFCQWCGGVNPEGQEVCVRCGSPLLVVSGAVEPPAAGDEELEEPLDKLNSVLSEDVLARLTVQEKQLARLVEAVEGLQQRVEELESSLALVEAGLRALSQLLDRRKVVRQGELLAAWEREAAEEEARHTAVEDLIAQREIILARARTLGTPAVRAYERALDTAELLLASGKVHQALGKLHGVLRRFPAHPEMAKLLSNLALEHGELGIARTALETLVGVEPGNVDALISLATLLADEGRMAEAEAMLRQAERLAKDSFLPPFALGALKMAQEDLAAARRYLARAVQREESPVPLFLLGLVELRLGRPARAVGLLERAVQLAPQLEEAIYTLGLAYLERGHTRKALQCFRQVLQLDPQRLRYQEAVRLLMGGREGLALPPELSQALDRAASASEKGQLALAWEALLQACQTHPHPSVEAAAALVASALGKGREAVRWARRVLQRRPEGPPRLAAWTALLETLRARGRYRLLQRLGSWLLQQGNSPLERGLAAYELSLGLVEQGADLDQAEDLAHQALTEFPSELRPYAQAAVGRVYLARERYQDALDYLQQAAEAAPSPQILTQLGLALLGAGEKQRARQVLQQAKVSEGADLKTDVLDHLVRVAWLSTRRS
ncbi:MAG: tetratricopeptide repeat protein [Thermoanaerobaculum sp.]|nr:tetratricopeptide repeat protein [Thermoanaerobaculum sp.]MDW7967595.1 tetratricopeptide repeat protein [Thermoanaerobaculum sp.]